MLSIKNLTNVGEIKSGRFALLVADPSCANSITRQNPPLCNPPIYIAIIFEPIKEFVNPFGEILSMNQIVEMRKYHKLICYFEFFSS